MKSSNWIIILLILALIFFLWKWRECTSTPCPTTDCVASCTAWCDSICAERRVGPCEFPDGYDSVTVTDAATLISDYNSNYKTIASVNNGAPMEKALIDYLSCTGYDTVSVELALFPGSHIHPIFYARYPDGSAKAIKKSTTSATETGPKCPTFCPKP